ncbi:hypothetical protein P12x_004355 [Tundrisphaera lichenicola]|uniref:hypothetical protein n=1 Tax=Tundrisphaera lichenicola TaxID=2029860 RepID=UPI003EC01774
MHQLILITAMSATTGLFGGGKHCGKAMHGRAVSSCAPAAYSAQPACGMQSIQQGVTYAPATPSMQGTPRVVPAMPAGPAPDMVPAAPSVPPAPPAPPVPPAAPAS